MTGMFYKDHGANRPRGFFLTFCHNYPMTSGNYDSQSHSSIVSNFTFKDQFLFLGVLRRSQFKK